MLGGVQWGMATDDENIYVAVSDIGLQRVAAGTPGGQKSIFGSTELKMDPRAGGGIFALKLATGEIVWHTPHPGCNDRPGCSPAQSAAVTAIPGIVFSGGLDGHLRAYAAKTGEIIWNVDTMQEYQTVNGRQRLAARSTALEPSLPVACSTSIPAMPTTARCRAMCC